MIDPILLAQDLIRLPSITPHEAGTLDLLQNNLEPLGFVCERFRFEETGTLPVDNLYAKIGNEAPHLTFIGHVDVVPTGDEALWTYPPFLAHIENGILYGRGIADMKGGVAAFVSALGDYYAQGNQQRGSLSLLITCDEEGPAINGVRKLIPLLQERGEKFDAALVGEPSNPHYLGEEIKIGRRGSLNGKVIFYGKQGHVAYPQLAENPIPPMLQFLSKINEIKWDQGTEHFPATNLEIISVDVANSTYNVIPQKIEAKFNLRFNPLHSKESLQQKIESCTTPNHHHFEWLYGGDAFYTKPGPFSDLLQKSIYEVTGKKPDLTTYGGTSDGRFIHQLCPVIEFGLVNRTIHQIDEHVDCKDIIALKNVYLKFITEFFKKF